MKRILAPLLLLASTLASAAPWDFLSPYLADNFGPVQESPVPRELEVDGVLPPGLEGLYLRNGPNPLYPPKPYHWFDGDGLVHAFRFHEGRVSYWSRFIETEGLVREREARKSLYGGLLAGPPFKNVANTSLIFHHGKLLALWEGGHPYELDPRTLATRAEYAFDGGLGRTMTAHPRIDPGTGEMFFFGYSVVAPYLTYYVASKEGKIIHKTPVQTQGPVFMHSFVVSERHAVFFDFPVEERFEGVADTSRHVSLVGLLPRYGEGGAVRWISMKKGFAFHFLNAWEEGDRLSVVGFRYPSFPSLKPPWVNPVPYLWVIDTVRGDLVEERPLSQKFVDFPFMNRDYWTKKARFGFASEMVALISTGLVKLDLEEGTVRSLPFGFAEFGGEGSFVPRAPFGEDDGWLLALVFNEITRRSELRIYDGKSFDKKPVARIALPSRIPYGFHGLWLDDRDLP